MGALLWFAKMLLKVLKPFAKVAIIQALLEAIGNVTEEPGEDAGEEESSSEEIIE